MSIDRNKPDLGEVTPVAETACILFDKATGAVHHIHHVVTLPGGETPSPEVVEQRARNLAAQTGRDTSHFDAIHVEPKQLQHNARSAYRVDSERYNMS
jgi:hypothetical protein